MASDVQVPVLLLGTFHMANPGQDVIKFEVDDVLAPHRQRELEDLGARLAAFKPTKVCVEVMLEHQASLDDAYAKYLAAAEVSSRDELYQVAFRVARLCKLERVHAIDDDTPMDWEGLEAYLASHPDENARYEEELRAEQVEAERESDRLRRSTIRDFMRTTNDEEALQDDLRFYIDVLALGGAGEHGGADVTASWYQRNIRIFSNLAGLTEPGDRVLVVFGAGHVPILRHLVGLSSGHSLVDPADYL